MKIHSQSKFLNHDPGAPKRTGCWSWQTTSELRGTAGRGRHPGSRDLLSELCSAHYPLTLLTLSDRLSETRGRVDGHWQDEVCRHRREGPMVDRIPQDVFTGLTRQLDAGTRVGDDQRRPWEARGVSFRITCLGGFGRQPVHRGRQGGTFFSPLIRPESPSQHSRRRMPHGFRLSGSDGAMVSARVMRSAERALRRIRTVADRLGSTVP